MTLPPLSAGLLAVLSGIALASLLVPTIALAAARRRSAPLRHGVLMCALAVLALVPAAPIVSRQLDLGWLPRWNLFISWQTPVSDFPATATGETSTADFRTLSAAEIPEGAILPGQNLQADDADETPFTNDSARSADAVSPWLKNSLNRRVLTAAAIALWLLGTCVSLLLTWQAATRVARLVRRSRPVGDAPLRALFHELAGDLHLRRPPDLRAAEQLRVPFAWGYVRPMVVVSQNLVESCDLVRLRPILLHELAHVRRRDVWIGLLQRIVGAMYWWNPLVHRLNACLADAREEICDAYVLNSGCSSREYAEILVDLAAQLSLPHPAAAPGLLNRSEPQLTRRVQRLLEDQPMSTSLRRLARLTLTGTFIALTTTAVLMAYVLIDNRMLDHSMTTFAAYDVHQNWTPPQQPTNVTPVSPASQQFVPSVSGPTNAPAMMGDEEMSMAATGGMMIAADDSFRPSDNDDAAFGSPMIAQGYGVGAVEVPSGGFPAGVQTGADPFAAGGTAPGLAIAAFGAPGGAAMAGMPGGRQLHVMSGDTLRGLAAIELIGNDDGTLKEVRWFTESLGTGDEAVVKLTERLTEFAQPRVGTAYRAEYRETSTGPVPVMIPVATAGSMAMAGGIGAGGPMIGGGMRLGPGGEPTIPAELTAQITASAQLRYEHVARVVELCDSHVQRVVVTQANLTPNITLTLGFVRDGSGKQISSSPVLIWNDAVTPAPAAVPNFDTFQPYQQELLEPEAAQAAPPQVSPPHDEVVTVESLTPRLLVLREMFNREPKPKNLTVLVRADAGVDPRLVERVVQVTLPAGFERVILQPLEYPARAPADAAPTIDPAAVPEPTAPANEPEQDPNSPDIGPIGSPAGPTGFHLNVPAMGPVPMAIDFANPIVGDTPDQNRVFNFYVGFTR
ncbi:MAG: M56 family metallopeptidase [Planctomycetaceae bacterium]|nr:M56 family metallopeptidase [Planctomycetaceae bacterium]